MFHGKNKAVTFSYDDGVTQDIRLIEMLNRYGLKSTFNLNSEFLGQPGSLIREDRPVDHNKVAPEDVAKIYKGHEVAVHTLTHPNLTTLDSGEIIHQVEKDRINLSELCGYEVIGMAYPCGGTNNDDRVADIILKNTPIRYARTITSSHSFDRQHHLLRFNPTVYHLETEKMWALADEFIALECDRPQIFYIWGHSYEFDIYNSWDMFEEFCAKISGHSDIFYGTNKEVLL